jgi:hypothetical protein
MSFILYIVVVYIVEWGNHRSNIDVVGTLRGTLYISVYVTLVVDSF